MLVSGLFAIWLNPLAIRAETRILNNLAAGNLTADVEPRVFEDQFTNDNTVLYVDDVKPSPPGSPVPWSKVVIFDTTKPEERKKGLAEKADGPLIPVARDAVATSDPKNNRIQLELHDYSSHEMGKDRMSHDMASPSVIQELAVKPAEQVI